MDTDEAENGVEEAGSEDIFSDIDEIQNETSLFQNRQLLHVGHVPKKDRIIGRDEEIHKIATEYYPLTQGNPANNILVYGKTGTGKSLVTRYVMGSTRKKGRSNGYDIATVYVDCSEDNTHTRAVREIAQSLAEKADENYSIPLTGIGSSEYYKYIWRILEEFDSMIIILDEIDKLDNDDILMQLSRAKETGSTSKHIQITAISNKIEYKDRLSERVLSSLSENEFVFHPYDATQLREILKKRKEAFKEGVLGENVIPLAAAFSAKEHGDARKAIDIFRKAGEIAGKKGSEKVLEEHIREAQDHAEMSRLKELISGSTPHVKLILYTLAQLTQDKTDNIPISTGDVYRNYRKVCDYVGIDSLGEERVYQLLKEQAFLGVLESEKTGGGRGRGMYLTHRLITDPKIVLSVVLDDQRLSSLKGVDMGLSPRKKD
ncbi:Cdc6/Cdc18 family protein (plasmid) [Halorutilales archaeon Cl-col2-1]